MSDPRPSFRHRPERRGLVGPFSGRQLLGAFVAIAAALGDLFESALKRDMQVKDSGTILAGHGGMLDRVDALLFAVPAAYFTVVALT